MGPTLFLLYTNDLPTETQPSARLFADDTNYGKMELWDKEWDMKCQHIITFVRKQSLATNIDKLHQTETPKTDTIKFLGLTIESKVNWNKHVDNTVSEASGTLSFIMRNILTSSKELKVTAYKHVVWLIARRRTESMGFDQQHISETAGGSTTTGSKTYLWDQMYG